MAKDLNKVQLTGNLGADPEMRYTASGSSVTTFRVASGRSYTDRDGQKHDQTEWFRVVAWDKLGEIVNQYTRKGSRIYVEGRLQTRKWEKDGQDVYTTEVIASDVILLDSRERGAAPAEDEGGLQGGGGDDDIPFGEEPEPVAAAPAPREPRGPNRGNGGGRGYGRH